MEEKAMLNQGKLLFILGLMLLVSCKTEEQKQKEIRERMVKKIEESNKLYPLYKNFSENHIGKTNYDQVYTSINDSIRRWANAKLTMAKLFSSPDTDWKIDSLLTFNKAKNRMITAVLYKNIIDATHDGLEFLYGAKIKEKWYLFGGPSVHLPREFYQSDESVPLSFEMLHKIAMNEIFRRYLTKTTQGNWEINDRFFTGRIDDTDCLDPFMRNGIKKYRNLRNLNKEEWEECMIRFTEAYWWTKSDLEDNPENDDPPI